MKLGELIKIYIIFHKISGRELAKEIGISTATVSRLLSGKTIDIRTTVKLFSWLILTKGER